MTQKKKSKIPKSKHKMVFIACTKHDKNETCMHRELQPLLITVDLFVFEANQLGVVIDNDGDDQ